MKTDIFRLQESDRLPPRCINPGALLTEGAESPGESQFFAARLGLSANLTLRAICRHQDRNRETS